MMTGLWDGNTPADFWRLQEPVPEREWHAAVATAASVLCLPGDLRNMHDLLRMTLGEGQFGAKHFDVPKANRLYYRLKAGFPRGLAMPLRRVLGRVQQHRYALGWPHDDRYARFLWLALSKVLSRSGSSHVRFRHFWPGGAGLALVLTHDVETAKGLEFVRAVADLDESYGFRSSFNLVPERYRLDAGLVDELRRRGFEIGVHGLTHDGRLFDSRRAFVQRAERINRYLREWGAVGFRAPYVMRNPDWMQALDVEYDASFFDTDPYQPMPGGTMCLWPFFLGRFVELPYTLAQDCVLVQILREETPDVWLRKVDMIARYRGMALLNAHPDYLRSPTCWRVYEQFLRAMRERRDYWHALPREVARWWRQRAGDQEVPGAVWGTLDLDAEGWLHVDGVPLWGLDVGIGAREGSPAVA